MPLVSPDVRITYLQDPAPLEDPERTVARIVYGRHNEVETSQLRVSLPPIGVDFLSEVWRTDHAIQRDEYEGFQVSCFGPLMFAYGVFDETDQDLQSLTRSVYERMLKLARTQGYPFLLRIWNYFPDIARSLGAGDRYRQFCEGRRQALLADESSREAPLPAVTTTGSQAPGLVVYFLAGQHAGVALHNPRQTAPCDYPEDLGPHGPSFCRGVVHESERSLSVYLSGTASITGHETRHPGDVAKQARELLRNHATVLEVAHQTVSACPTQLQALPFEKVYLAHARDQAVVEEILREQFGPDTPHYFLHSPLCRSDLLLEMESLWQA